MAVFNPHAVPETASPVATPGSHSMQTSPAPVQDMSGFHSPPVQSPPPAAAGDYRGSPPPGWSPPAQGSYPMAEISPVPQNQYPPGGAPYGQDEKHAGLSATQMQSPQPVYTGGQPPMQGQHPPMQGGQQHPPMQGQQPFPGGQQNMQNMQNMGAVQVQLLRKDPGMIDCPFCHQRGVTRVTSEAGSEQGFMMCILCLICCPLVFLPPMLGWGETQVHRCCHCNQVVATYKA